MQKQFQWISKHGVSQAMQMIKNAAGAAASAAAQSVVSAAVEMAVPPTPPPPKVWCVTLRRNPPLTDEDYVSGQPLGECQKRCWLAVLGPPALFAYGIGWMIYDQQAKYNAVTYDMRRAIPRIMADFEADDDVRVAKFQVGAEGQLASRPGRDGGPFRLEGTTLGGIAPNIWDQADLEFRLLPADSRKPITRNQFLRIFLWPFTMWDLDTVLSGETCETACIPAAPGLEYNYNHV